MSTALIVVEPASMPRKQAPRAAEMSTCSTCARACRSVNSSRSLVSGAKSGRTKDLIKSYITNLQATIDELKAAEEKEEGDSDQAMPATEEEEEKALRTQHEKWKAQEQALLDEVGRRTFAGWSDRDWKDLAKNYFKSL